MNECRVSPELARAVCRMLGVAIETKIGGTEEFRREYQLGL